MNIAVIKVIIELSVVYESILMKLVQLYILLNLLFNLNGCVQDLFLERSEASLRKALNV